MTTILQEQKTADPKIRVCASDALLEGQKGIRFEVQHPSDGAIPAFLVRIGGEVKGYINRCSHISVEMDWPEGQFLDDSGLYIVCATHGAMYDATNGQCVGGPCRGQGLYALQTEEIDGSVWCTALYR